MQSLIWPCLTFDRAGGDPQGKGANTVIDIPRVKVKITHIQGDTRQNK